MYCCQIGSATVTRSNSTRDTQQRTKQQKTHSCQYHDKLSMNTKGNIAMSSDIGVTHRCNAMDDFATMCKTTSFTSAIHSKSERMVSFVYVLRTHTRNSRTCRTYCSRKHILYLYVLSLPTDQYVHTASIPYKQVLYIVQSAAMYVRTSLIEYSYRCSIPLQYEEQVHVAATLAS